MKTFLPILLLVPFLASADMIAISPDSYQFDQGTDAGSYIYNDWTGQQLTDGIYGEGFWASDLGNGPAYEWVGWYNKNINVDFTFDTIRTFNEITVSTQQANGGLVLPSLGIYAWLNDNWVLQATKNVTRINGAEFIGEKLTLSSLAFSTDKVRISLLQNGNGHWIFVDEIVFSQTPQTALFDALNFGVNDVPAPFSFGLLVATLIGLRVRIQKLGSPPSFLP